MEDPDRRQSIAFSSQESKRMRVARTKQIHPHTGELLDLEDIWIHWSLVKSCSHAKGILIERSKLYTDAEKSGPEHTSSEQLVDRASLIPEIHPNNHWRDCTKRLWINHFGPMQLSAKSQEKEEEQSWSGTKRSQEEVDDGMDTIEEEREPKRPKAAHSTELSPPITYAESTDAAEDDRKLSSTFFDLKVETSEEAISATSRRVSRYFEISERPPLQLLRDVRRHAQKVFNTMNEVDWDKAMFWDYAEWRAWAREAKSKADIDRNDGTGPKVYTEKHESTRRLHALSDEWRQLDDEWRKHWKSYKK